MLNQTLLRGIDTPNLTDVDVYISHGGYRGLQKALSGFTPAALIDLVSRSGLRGRGGAGFPTGIKWGFVPKDPAITKYLCCNADEGEPGTFKDRQIIEKNPHLLIEGIIISSYAIGASVAFIYIRGEFAYGATLLEKAVAQAYDRNFLGKNILGSRFCLDIFIHRGAGAYICGEETALIESLEGNRGMPRLKPPFPAAVGLYNKPTVINNVETLSNISHIVLNGAEWFSNIGVARGAGTKIYVVSGHVNKPGAYELPMGINLRELIFDYAGGMKDQKKLKAVIPGGSSTPILVEKDIDVKMDFDSVAQAGSQLGSGAVVVMDETTCMVRVAMRLVEFYAHESCGKCTPCREGCPWLAQTLRRIEHGKGRHEDLDLLEDICANMKGRTFCPMGTGAISPVVSTLQHFRQEYMEHITVKRCPFQ
jgi:NADH-quinone oxidoreductase subunit F